MPKAHMDIQPSQQTNTEKDYSMSESRPTGRVEGSSPGSKSNKKLITVLVVILLILAASAGAYWYFTQSDRTTHRSSQDMYVSYFHTSSDGSVYYQNKKGEQLIIAQSVSIPMEPTRTVSYKMAKESPDGRFVALGSERWEASSLEVYEIATNKIYKANATGSDFGFWLPDSKLHVEGECGMGIDCGIFESKNNQQPWILEKIGDYTAPDPAACIFNENKKIEYLTKIKEYARSNDLMDITKYHEIVDVYHDIIEKIESKKQRQEACVVVLDCCFMGDRAYINPKSGEIIKFELGNQ